MEVVIIVVQARDLFFSVQRRLKFRVLPKMVGFGVVRCDSTLVPVWPDKISHLTTDVLQREVWLEIEVCLNGSNGFPFSYVLGL